LAKKKLEEMTRKRRQTWQPLLYASPGRMGHRSMKGDNEVAREGTKVEGLVRQQLECENIRMVGPRGQYTRATGPW